MIRHLGILCLLLAALGVTWVVLMVVGLAWLVTAWHLGVQSVWRN